MVKRVVNNCLVKSALQNGEGSPMSKKLKVAEVRSQVSSCFDSGNIEVVSLPPAEGAGEGPRAFSLQIRPDPYCDADSAAHFQWYHFRASGVREVSCVFNLTNARGASYEEAWEEYQSTASYDRQHWFRVPTSYDQHSGVLSINHTPDQDLVYYAFFAPYSLDRHADLVAWAVKEGGARLSQLGGTVDGRDLDLLTAGTGPKKIWIIARQHPGESMAEWWAEGMLKRLLNPHDAVAQSLLRSCTFYVIPNMNPDGSTRGHLRCNAVGRNLNREWASPCPSNSPEVYLTLQAMDQIGVDFFLDVHGDEVLPYNFIVGNEGIEGWSDRLEGLQNAFKQAYLRHSPDFQVEHGYPKTEPGKANMGIATAQVGQRFNCLSMTLEQPFKDTADTPNAVQGWSPERCLNFGASVLGAIAEVVKDLR
eukprot:CAMPEP_0196581862 /NCGR_PEP_ID=MMETSP1081-20130531/36049_1 /TAXON_ID=36882 /ORGANISM="Pyramimonas amylifera, Strain CCMP720" /LENGTH=419 /DNA_ID=CAMNT_0041902247 /DNA_START=83 /DNA_END=1342 /DNA_ORIENTATION=+